MYIRESILFVFFVVSVYQTAAKPRDGNCPECVHYNFEQDFTSIFSTGGLCDGLQTWTEDKYASSDVAKPNDYSQSFISPRSNLSCASSFPFTMSGGGTIDIRVYMDSAYTAHIDYINVMAEELSENGYNTIVGSTTLSSTELDYKKGWQTITVTVYGSKTFTGHITFLGVSTSGSIVIVDAFCYKPPNYEGECWVHDYLTTTAEPESTAPEVTESTSAPDSESTTSAATNPGIGIGSVSPAHTTTEQPASTRPTPTTESSNNVTSVPIVTNATTLSPPITPPTFPTQAPGVESRCPDDLFIHWLLPHEKKCNLFYYCVWGEKVLRECPEGLHFNPEIQVCDWPYDAGCKM